MVVEIDVMVCAHEGYNSNDSHFYPSVKGSLALRSSRVSLLALQSLHSSGLLLLPDDLVLLRLNSASPRLATRDTVQATRGRDGPKGYFDQHINLVELSVFQKYRQQNLNLVYVSSCSDAMSMTRMQLLPHKAQFRSPKSRWLHLACMDLSYSGR